MSSSKSREWDERRSPQWRYFLQQNNPKNKKQKQKEHHRQMAHQKKQELEELMDCAPRESVSSTDLESAYENVVTRELTADKKSLVGTVNEPESPSSLIDKKLKSGLKGIDKSKYKEDR
jgi:1,4-alpha-glucan branching enzyme